MVFGMSMLRMISFNMEFKRQNTNKLGDLEFNSENHQLNCDECKKSGQNCLKYLVDVPVKLQDYNLLNYIIYILYPPLYFSGPIITFNSFINQVHTQTQAKLTNDKIKYIIRYIFIFICFEIFNSYIYVNAFLTNSHNLFLLEKLDFQAYVLFSFWLLIFLWFKFSVIWKTARLWSMLDGILTEENMNRCIINNYCFEGFWRAWHRSFNIWLIRYIFIPLGGSKYKIYNIWVVFTFVALWHDLQLNLLIWGWFICLFLIPEMLVKNYFNQEKVKYIYIYYFFILV
jgi:D-alanyl-lipoteichoic acid acyltransferase DltB (MBOAT superfamily)